MRRFIAWLRDMLLTRWRTCALACPRCGADIEGVYLQAPWYVKITTIGAGEGVQRCPACQTRWLVYDGC